MNQEEQQYQHLLDECRTIAENCLYTAQAHFVTADRAETRSQWFLTVPSVVAGICGLLVALGFPNWIGAVAAVAGTVSTVASSLGVDRLATEHRILANSLTALRHEARTLQETMWREISHEQLVAEVRRLTDKYNALIQGPKATDIKSFEVGRRRIKAGLFEPDDCKGSKRGANGHC
ncbi:Uncharacterized [Moorella glycerini]|uniref:SMODS and SLOG-associating 2TM effector domain-containing protein n=1 Tax=Neomoorella stamsii TaxID=1266720 RepID=A0A9X7J5R6_9FIRM|nr:hypothetical protein MOST_00020 [Moorella stamsii]CEP66427.1 Uncharacterized [Moorella glycerini]